MLQNRKKGAELNMHRTLYVFGDKGACKLFAPIQHDTRENLKKLFGKT